MAAEKRCRLCGRGYANWPAHMEECGGPEPAWLYRVATTGSDVDRASTLEAVSDWLRKLRIERKGSL